MSAASSRAPAPSPQLAAASAASDVPFLVSTGEGVKILAAERARATFDVRKMMFFLDGGEEITLHKEEIAKLVEADRVLLPHDRYDLNHQESVARSMEKFKHVVKQTIGGGLAREDGVLLYYYVNEPMPTSLHHGMFLPTLLGQGSDEQRAEWLPKASMFSIVGAYAQTELGHGSNVRGLETTATYDPSTQEFVLHSPTLTSAKWWPGGLGAAATHAVVHARLLLSSTDHGIHTFVVQLRDLESHAALPGILVGDIGPKMGWNTVDNGLLAFNQVRVPRKNMLARYASVSPEGEYAIVGHPKSGYGTMILIRSALVRDASDALARACTIAIRYSAVRRQGPSLGPDGEEHKVLDYQMQAQRLLSLLATAYAYRMTGFYMSKLYQRLQADIEDNDLSVLPEVHATSSGLKAMCTVVTADGIEDARRACGGHGFSAFSGLPYLLSWYSPAVTFEGDSIVLQLQTARYLLKSRATALEGKPLTGGVAYLNGAQPVPLRTTAIADMRSHTTLLAVLESRALAVVSAAATHMQTLLGRGVSWDEAWNQILMTELCAASRAHCEFIVARNFVTGLRDVDDPQLSAVLGRLAALYMTQTLLASAGSLLEFAILRVPQLRLLREVHAELLRDLRPDAVPLVDAFNFPDFLLNSSLGRADGAVYESLMESALACPTNTAPERNGFAEHLRPVIDKSLFTTPSKL
eukprot:c52510_g1_i1.p1 GENE.c52510_g1_i1~~c52510_g1_i1.p1  ORF type:complete len:724 (+),score=107.53 c52510_g1_i1:88-2172(+)